NLRGNLRTAMQIATDRTRQASAFLAYHGEHTSNNSLQLLQQARAAMPTALAGAGADAINRNIAAAYRARDLAEQAYNRAQSENAAYEEEQDRQEQSEGAD